MNLKRLTQIEEVLPLAEDGQHYSAQAPKGIVLKLTPAEGDTIAGATVLYLGPEEKVVLRGTASTNWAIVATTASEVVIEAGAVLPDGTVPMTGDLDLGDNDIVNAPKLLKVVETDEFDVTMTAATGLTATLPLTAKIVSVEMLVTEAWDGTTPTVNLGYLAGVEDVILDGAELGAAVGGGSLYPVDAANVAEWEEVSDDAEIAGKFVGGGSNTTGKAKFRITYFVPVAV